MSKSRTAVLILLALFSHSSKQLSAQSVDITPSLKSVLLAGRIVSPSSPDGVGTEAFIESASRITGCEGNLYFYDNYGLRRVRPDTRQVLTLIPSDTITPKITCDGAYVYSTGTPLGLLTVSQYEISTGKKTTFGYPQVDSFNRGTSENSLVAGRTLYTTDSASGRIWKIDLTTRERTLVIDFGGPVILPAGPGLGNKFPTIDGVGPFWIADRDLYLVHDGGIHQINLDTGASLRLMDWPSLSFLWGESRFLYFRGTLAIRKLDVISGEITEVAAGLSIQGLWGDSNHLYFTEATAVGKIDKESGQVSFIAGELFRRVDGTGSTARFEDTFTRFMNIAGDSQLLFIEDHGFIRIYDKATGYLSTLSGLGPFNIGGMWTNGNILVLSDGSCIRRIDLATREMTILAGIPGQTFGQFADGIGSNARFDSAQDLWSDGRDVYINDNNRALRKLDLSTRLVTTLVSDRRDGSQESHSFGGIWGMGSYLYYRDGFAIMKMAFDTGETSTVSQSVQFGVFDRLWGNGNHLYVVHSNNRILRVDPDSGATSTIYTSADLISEGISGDGSGLYVIVAYALRRLQPDILTRVFGISNEGLSIVDVDAAPSLTIVQSEVHLAPGSPPSSVTAIWSYRNPEGVLVSEASVEGQVPIRAGRIYAEVGGSLNTGIALSNPNDVDVRIDFHFTDRSGVNFGNGFAILKSHTQLARFLNEKPFDAGSNIEGTFTFTATMPIVAIAIRGFTNERSEFLMTTLPAVDLDAPIARTPITLAHYAAGGGWKTQILLVNPSEEPAYGTIHFRDDSGFEGRRETYQLSPGSSDRLSFGEAGGATRVGSVEIEPSGGSPSPTALAVFSYAPDGVTVTETGTPSAEGSVAHSYIEVSNSSDLDPVNSGIAIANPIDRTVRVRLYLTSPNGDNAGSVFMTLPARGHISRFVSELFPALQTPFTGVLRVSATEEGSAILAPISLIGLRGRYNSRNEFIVSTVKPVVEGAPQTTQFYLPHLVTGGGYNTRIFVVNIFNSWSAGDIQFRTADGLPIGASQQ